ncbi:hypothetical protein [Robiginitalea sp.]|uniref:hypothetical protein n=1 Tax=Robiginitalea sp. TaxID=1902411 RepID=UPI003C72E4A2
MKKYTLYFTLVLMVFTLSCKNDDDATIANPNDPDSSGPVTEIPSDPERVDYQLFSVNDSGVTGIAAFIPREDGTTTVYIELENATQDIHPARILFGDVDAPGSLAISLNDCECKISETIVTELDNGSSVSFVELMTFDGHLNILQSPTDGTILAHTNIGANAF